MFVVEVVGDKGISHLKHLRHLQSGPHPWKQADALELNNAEAQCQWGGGELSRVLITLILSDSLHWFSVALQYDCNGC